MEHENASPTPGAWTFLTNYMHVLICIASDPGIRVRDIAPKVGITERAVQRIVSDLADAGYLKSSRHGRRNHYEIDGSLPLRHPLEAHKKIGDVLRLMASPPANPLTDDINANK